MTAKCNICPLCKRTKAFICKPAYIAKLKRDNPRIYEALVADGLVKP